MAGKIVRYLDSNGAIIAQNVNGNVPEFGGAVVIGETTYTAIDIIDYPQRGGSGTTDVSLAVYVDSSEGP